VTGPLDPVRGGSRPRTAVGLGAIAVVTVLLAGVGFAGRMTEQSSGLDLATAQPSTVPASPVAGTPEPTAACPASTVVTYGSWWMEVGGDHAFIQATSADGSHYAGPWPWLITVRFDPDAPRKSQVQMWAERLDEHAGRVDGVFNSRQDLSNIYRGADPAPKLAGGAYLFEQRLPVPGCWRLSAGIDGRVVGSAIVRVMPAAPTSAAVGTFMANKAVGADPCFAFQNASYSRQFPREVQAWWWDQGASGDCRTRSSDLFAARATIVPRDDSGYDLVLGVPPPGGATQELRVTLYPHMGDLAGVALSAGNASVFFTQVSKVEPTLSVLDLASCRPTRPKPVFVAPPPAPAKAPARYNSDWYGSAALWTMLEHDGEVWRGLPNNNGVFGQKTFWWSANWPVEQELEPRISVTGRRLDGPGRFEAGNPGTNASADFGTAMLVGVGIPSTGCWQISAAYRGAELTYVVLVED
jgi:hypothetical protein